MKAKCSLRRRGGISVLVALSILVLSLFMTLVLEWSRVMWVKYLMQNRCDTAALAGARSLPKEQQAKDKAIEYYARNADVALSDIKFLGRKPLEIRVGDVTVNTTESQYKIGDDTVTVTTPYLNAALLQAGISANNAIEVRSSRTVNLLLGKLVGQETMEVTARSVGARTRATSKISIFSGLSAGTGLVELSGSGIEVGQSMHSNDDIKLAGSGHIVRGLATYVDNISITGSGHQIIYEQDTARPFPELPSPLDTYKATAQANGTYYTDDLTFTGQTLDGVVFVEGGNLIIDSLSLTGNVTFIAVSGGNPFKGKINFKGDGNSFTAKDNQLLLYAENGIRMTGTGNTLTGLIYTPQNVHITEGFNVIQGGLVGGTEVRIAGSSNRLKGGSITTKEPATMLFE